jgi:hypothetical protein
MATLKWKFADDDGIIHTFLIPNSYYVPDGNMRLLSPQHWAQTQKDRHPIEGTGEDTNGNRTLLYWNQHKHKLTTPLSKNSNVATFYLAPGYSNHQAFCAEAGIDLKTEDTDPIIASTVVTDDEEEDSLEDLDFGSERWHKSTTERKVRFGATNPDSTRVHDTSRDQSSQNPPSILRTPVTASGSVQPTTTAFNLNGPNAEEAC